MNVTCRRMFLQLFNDNPAKNNKTVHNQNLFKNYFHYFKDDLRTIQKIENFKYFTDLCNKTNITGN